MSDGMSDAYQDQCHGRAKEDMLKALAKYLANESADTKAVLIAKVVDLDSYRDKYHKMTEKMEAWLTDLRNQDTREWAKLLTPLVDEGDHRWGYGATLVAMSPFRGQRLVIAFQGVNFSQYRGDIGQFFEDAKIDARKRRTAFRAKFGNGPANDTGTYLIAVEADGPLKMHAEHIYE